MTVQARAMSGSRAATGKVVKSNRKQALTPILGKPQTLQRSYQSIHLQEELEQIGKGAQAW